MSEAEDPRRVERVQHAREVTLEDVRQLMGASTPHFALQLRNRIARLIADLPPGHPARVEGEREIARLQRLGYSGEVRGGGGEPGERPLLWAAQARDEAGDRRRPAVGEPAFEPEDEPDRAEEDQKLGQGQRMPWRVRALTQGQHVAQRPRAAAANGALPVAGALALGPPGPAPGARSLRRRSA